MAEFKFTPATFVTVQNLVYPLIATFLDFNPAEWVGDQSELFIKVGDGLGDLSALFILIGTALEDGILTVEEIEAIIAKALTLPEAIDAISEFFEDDTPEV